MDHAVTQLFVEAERKAQRFSAFVRAIIALVFLVAFAIGKPADLPPSFIAIVYIGVSAYLLLGIAAYVLATPRLFRPWMELPLFALDMAVYVFVLVGAARAFQVSLVQAAALPPFLFIFILMALNAMRFNVWAVRFQSATILLTGLTWVLAEVFDILPRGTAALRADQPVFSAEANFVRLLMIIGAGAVLVLTVIRTRRLLIDAITVTQRTANLSRYLPKAVADRVAEQGIEALQRGRIQKAAVLFADIAGFSALAEKIEPVALGTLLGELRAIQREVVERHDGVVDKYIGDAVMAVFGVPEPRPDDAARALAASLAMRDGIAAWNAGRAAAGLPPLRVGIGLHYGDVFAGAIGDAQRLEFATLGDTVNVAQRVEGLTRLVDAPLLATREAVAAAGADPAAWQALPPQPVKGRSEPVAVLRPRAAEDQRRK
ncbi:MAG TPA: adenylate/guanylate cyclase domain-containing protein [Alphaproteobacteria bacterium]|nr:adenylate/guanylate cyclase domain-containing protein [Alphaproteobacteria bacterium]